MSLVVVAGGESIVVRSQTPLMSEVSGLVATIERDDGIIYMVAFNSKGTSNGDEEENDSGRTDNDGSEAISDSPHEG